MMCAMCGVNPVLPESGVYCSKTCRSRRKVLRDKARTDRCCSKCRVLLPPGRAAWYCEGCVIAYSLERRGGRPARVVVKGRGRRDRSAILRFWSHIFRWAPCVDCGLVDPNVIEFDHVPGRGVKRGLITDIVSFGSAPRFWAEMDKCEPVCPTCHRRRTVRRMMPNIPEPYYVALTTPLGMQRG